jgi:hypothetical protein
MRQAAKGLSTEKARSGKPQKPYRLIRPVASEALTIFSSPDFIFFNLTFPAAISVSAQDCAHKEL